MNFNALIFSGKEIEFCSDRTGVFFGKDWRFVRIGLRFPSDKISAPSKGKRAVPANTLNSHSGRFNLQFGRFNTRLSRARRNRPIFGGKF